MPMIYWCCSGGKVYPHVWRLLLYSFTVLRPHYSRVIYRVSSVRCLQTAEVCFALKAYVHSNPSILSTPGQISHKILTVPLVPSVLYSSQQHLQCKSDSNDSLGSLGNQVLRDQERSISHFSSERRDKEMVRQRESRRKRGLEGSE